MKKILSTVCFLMHLMLVAFAEIFVIATIVNYIADKTGYYGIWNVFLFLGVAAAWLFTYFIFIKECEYRKNS